ncbi:MAG: hypothetical protein ACM3TN_10940 [Alphaproteobacteria bacterium]
MKLQYKTSNFSFALIWILAGISAAGCGATAPTITTGAFTQVARLETDLHRGVSTKMDVQRILGVPKGFGGAILPTDPREREVWYYEDIEITGMSSETGGVIRANMRQQVLNVFFQNGVFDGFMWFSNAGIAAGK